RVRYCECDPMNVAHHSSFVAWFELARTELLRNRGTIYADLERAGVLLMVRTMDVRYRSPVAYDDVVEIRTRVEHLGRARVTHDYEVRVIESGGQRVDARLAAEASIELACCGRDGRPRPLPDELRS
ncbi:MAG: thioesterase family protein, partial [Planctomycetota bacterium]